MFARVPTHRWEDMWIRGQQEKARPWSFCPAAFELIVAAWAVGGREPVLRTPVCVMLRRQLTEKLTKELKWSRFDDMAQRQKLPVARDSGTDIIASP